MQVSTKCYQILYCIFPQTETSDNYGKVSLLCKGWWLRHFLQNAFVEVRFCVASCFLPVSSSSRVYCSPSTGDTPPLPTPANSPSIYSPQSIYSPMRFSWSISIVKTHSHQAKAKFFYLYCFSSHFRLVWTGPYDPVFLWHFQILINSLEIWP